MSLFFKKIKIFIKNLDFFGVYYTFHYKENDRFHSVTGGIIFLIYIIFILIYMYINSINFIQKKNMSLIYYDRRIDRPYYISFKNYSNNFAIGLDCSGLSGRSIYDYLTLDLQFISQNRTNTTSKVRTYTNITLHKCEKNDFSGFDREFEENNLNRYYCPDDISNEIGGFYTDTIFNYYQITVQSKENSIEYWENIKDILINYECRYEIYYIDTTINVYDYNNPVKQYLNQGYAILKPNTYIKHNYFFKRIEFKTGENFFIDSYKTMYFIGYSQTDSYNRDLSYERYDKKYNDYNIFGKFFLRSDNKDNIARRKYAKINDYLAQISTVISLSFLLVYSFVFKLNYFFSNLYLMKNVFNFDLTEEKYLKKSDKNEIILFKSINNNNSNLSVNKDFKLNSEININNDSNKILVNYNQNKKKFFGNINLKKKNNNNLPQFSNYSKKFSINQKIIKNNNLRKNNNKFSINIFEYFYIKFFYFCKNKKINNKKILFDKCKMKLLYKMDIIEYIQYARKIELIYYIILNKKERILLNYLKNPYINLKNELNFYESKNLDLYYDIFSNKEKNDVILAFNYIINQNGEKNYFKNKVKKYVFAQLKNSFYENNNSKNNY